MKTIFTYIVLTISLVNCSNELPTQTTNRGTGTVKGFVYQINTKVPIPDVFVEIQIIDPLRNSEPIYDYTLADGSFELINVPEGTRKLRAKKNYEKFEQIITVVRNQTTTLVIFMKPPGPNI